MASQADIAAAMIAGMAPPSGNSDTGFEIGQIVSWDEASGVNTITVRGTTMNNLKCIQSGIGVLYQPGDTIAVFRFQTNYFVWGKIAAPGAGSASQIRVASDPTLVLSHSSLTYADLAGSVGPTLTNVYIGSSRRCLVLVSAAIYGNQTYGFAGFQVSGDSIIAPGGSTRFAMAGTSAGGVTQVGAVSTAQVLLTAADGLNQGFHTFQMKYAITKTGTGSGADFGIRTLTVIPF